MGGAHRSVIPSTCGGLDDNRPTGSPSERLYEFTHAVTIMLQPVVTVRPFPIACDRSTAADGRTGTETWMSPTEFHRRRPRLAMAALLVGVCVSTVAGVPASADQGEVYRNPHAGTAARVADLVR